MKKIIYTLPDGTVQTVSPSRRFVQSFPTEREGIQAVIDKDVPAGATDILVVEDDDLPKDGPYRFAWKRPDGGLPVVDMDKAKAIHTALVLSAKQRWNRVLVEREQLGDDTTADRARLRNMDVSGEIDAAATFEELRAVWPPGLPR